MREADGALISHLDDLQARLSRVAALSAPVDVAFASARPSPARALKSRAAHSPRPTPVPHSPPASPALEGRAAYYQTRDVVPRRAKARHQLGGSETARGPPSPFATRHETTRDFRDSALFHHRANAPPSPRASSSPIRPSPASNEPPPSEREGLERGQRERENVLRKTYDASFYVAELDATRAKLLDAESRFSAARRDAEVLAERLRLAGEAEAACAARVRRHRGGSRTRRAGGDARNGETERDNNERDGAKARSARKKRKTKRRRRLRVARGGGGASRRRGGARRGCEAGLGARRGPRARRRAGPETRGSLPARRGPRRRRRGIEEDESCFAQNHSRGLATVVQSTLLENEALPTNAREGHSPRRGAGSSARAAMDLPAARGASASGGGAPSEAQQDMWCHDCVGAFRLPASALSRDSDPTCSRCASTFVEAVEPPPGGGMHIELGADASPEDVVAAARQIVRRLAGADGTHVAAASASTAATAETEIEIVAREAWSALLGAHGFPFRTQNVVSPFGLSPGGAASFQFGGSIPARAAGAPGGVPTADAFFGGDVNIAELDTRTFFSPAHPDAVSRLPRVTVASRGNRTGDGPGARGDDDDTGCPVCLTDMEAPEGATLREMPCGHRFHEQCLLEWLRTKNTCPVCRVALPSAPGARP